MLKILLISLLVIGVLFNRYVIENWGMNCESFENLGSDSSFFFCISFRSIDRTLDFVSCIYIIQKYL